MSHEPSTGHRPANRGVVRGNTRTLRPLDERRDTVTRLVDRAFEQSAVSGATKGQVNRKVATKQAAGVATRRAKKVSIATRRK